MTTDLFTPLSLGSLELPNRVWLAPLTRARAEAGHIPGPLMAEYYGQRASAGLSIAEATMVMEGNSAFIREPGIHSAAQVEGWRLTTDAVHGRGGRIVLQIWHGGRACHPLLNDGRQPVAPSAIAITGDEVHTPEGKQPYVLPRELADGELPGIVQGFRLAARNAIAAGFDGVEVHGANGYLLDSFLRDGSNRRSGAYGGPIENRARLLLEVIEAVRAETELVGLRISPLNSYNSMLDSDPIGLSTWLAKRLNDTGLAYLHLMRGDFFQQQHGDLLTPIREHFNGVLVANMGYDAAGANAAISAGAIDAVAFGSAFLANPDLPERLRRGAPLNAADPATFYSPGPAGYTDYPFLP
ncbi:alkene reductase [Synechococcus sp. CS-1325]|uniref:alkene reductase n=1 Tax=unclassified Synechococcus TaxID=2626047 RepID=UPI000DB2EB9E|nr:MULTISPECIES: alkene reductase [unclassified Synechococcus]MCT0198437.1 alkene reductase [Synechococcus sp. CS-1325]MCT0213557.1 alkene reductase [Synechococcus sp. CS-1326]MCT0232148.1 alkene reductase [Synechococcus sp. CS-1327]PZU99188.1 MAG: alkene reductase [Cyanobium sp.]